MRSPTAPPSLTLDAPIDLQIHSTYSDGAWSAEQLLDYVVSEGFALVAVTDHDRPDTTADVQRLAAQRGIYALAAVEMTSLWHGKFVDVLCYGFDPVRKTLQAVAESTMRGQRENIADVYANLRRDGYQFPNAEAILARSNGEPRHFGDVAALLEGHGYADNLRATVIRAGYRWIAADLAVAVEAAHADGGVCLIAHPGRGEPYVFFNLPQLDRLRAAIPIDGLEVYHPSHAPELAAAYLSYARTHGLLISSGSDSHGMPDQMPIKYRAEISRHLLERVGILVRPYSARKSSTSRLNSSARS